MRIVMNCPSQKYAVSVPASVLASASRPGKLQFLDPFAAPACPQGTFFFSARLFDCATLSGSWSGVTLTASADQVPGHLGLYGGG